MYEWANEMNCAVTVLRHKGNHPIYERESMPYVCQTR